MIVHLNRQSHTPLYLQIAQQLKALITEGALKIGDQLPPSRELATSLGVHRITINNAYAELEADGVINAHVGRGTFVAAYPRAIKNSWPIGSTVRRCTSWMGPRATISLSNGVGNLTEPRRNV